MPGPCLFFTSGAGLLLMMLLCSRSVFSHHHSTIWQESRSVSLEFVSPRFTILFTQPFQALKSTLTQTVLLQLMTERTSLLWFNYSKVFHNQSSGTILMPQIRSPSKILKHLYYFLLLKLSCLFECLHFKSAKLYCVSQVIQGLLAVLYNLGDGDYNLTLPHHRLDNGEWHEVELDRYGREFTLRLDGGGGRREVTASPGQSQEIIIDSSVVMLGNSFPSGHNRSFLGTWLPTCFCRMRLNEWILTEELIDQ